MNKKVLYIIFLGAVLVLLILGILGYGLWKKENNKYLNFKDPKLTNEEIATVESKITELENKVNGFKNDKELKGNEDKKSDLFKAHMELSTYYRLRGRLLDAKKQIQEAANLKPDNISPFSELYIIEVARGNFSGAESALKKGLAIDPTNAQFWRYYIELASIYQQRSVVEMDKLYQEALQKSGNNVDLITLYAKHLEIKNDLAGAVGQWKKAKELNPSNTSIYSAEISRIQAKLQ